MNLKITKVSIKDFMGARSVDLALNTPVTLVCGPNASGKSSIRDAVALALSGELSRVTMKKDAGALVTVGAKEARISVEFDDCSPSSATIRASGAMKCSPMKSAALPYVLDAQRFAHLGMTERRAFLFGLAGLSTGPSDVARNLLGRGCSPEKVEIITPTLKDGFEAAAKAAAAQATGARGAWSEITSEAYGSQKAGGWAPAAVEAVPTEVAEACAAELDRAYKLLSQSQQALGAAKESQRLRVERIGRIEVLNASAAMEARIRTKLATDEAGLAEWIERVQGLEVRAGTGPRVGMVHDLAAALHEILEICICADDEGLLAHADQFTAARLEVDAYERAHGKIGAAGDPEALSMLPAARCSHEVMRRAVDACRRDLAKIEADKAELQRLQAEPAGEIVSVSTCEVAVSAASSMAREKRRELEAMGQAASAHANAAGQAARASSAHASVVEWVQIASALAPDGIQAEMLADALDPINEMLATFAEDACWSRVGIGSDMTISVGPDAREYRLCSESERWRADAMIAAAVSIMSGACLLLLDRFDVLDAVGRSDCLYWLESLTTDSVGTVMLFGTLKEPPKGLPESISAVWMGGVER